MWRCGQIQFDSSFQRHKQNLVHHKIIKIFSFMLDSDRVFIRNLSIFLLFCWWFHWILQHLLFGLLNRHKSKQLFWTDMVNMRNVILALVIDCTVSSGFFSSPRRSFKPNTSSCLNHFRFTMLQSPPLSQARIGETVRCSEDLSDKVRSEGVFGYGSGPVSCESPSLKQFNQ